MATGV